MLPSSDTRLEDVSEEMIDRHREDEYLEIVRKIRLEFADKSNECELLQLKLEESNQDVDHLTQELNECKLKIFENNEDSRTTREEVMKSQKLEEDYVKLMTDFIDLSIQNDQFKRNLIDSYLAKTNAINNQECLASSEAISRELDECKLNYDNKLAELNLALAKIKNLEDENVVKEKSKTELKKALEDAKVTHKHEITVLEEYIQCLKNTISSYEKTLASYINPITEP